MDSATAHMPEDDPPVRIVRIDLAPKIVIGPATDVAKIERLVRLAHEQCYIANSLTTRIEVVPLIVRS